MKSSTNGKSDTRRGSRRSAVGTGRCRAFAGMQRSVTDGCDSPRMTPPDDDDPCPIPELPEEPPAADIPGAIARTKHALLMLTDADAFEEIAIVCLQEFIPSLRRCGGPGDEQRDGVAGSLRADKGETIVTASLRRDWRVKVRSDLDGIDAHEHDPELVVAVTNQRTASKTATALERETNSRGYRLRVIDVGFLALRLLTPELLAAREELLGLPLPHFPVAVIPEEFARRQPNFGAPVQLIGRSEELDQLVVLVQDHAHVDIVGAGGIGKTRLVLEATKRAQTGRTLVLDHGTRLDSDVLATELAGADRLVLVIDNAHRRDDLAQIVALLSARNGPASLIYHGRASTSGSGKPRKGRGSQGQTPVRLSS